MKDYRPKNKITTCRDCGGKLTSDKNKEEGCSGFAYRSRVCLVCGTVWHTKQPPEEITGVERVGSANAENMLAHYSM